MVFKGIPFKIYGIHMTGWSQERHGRFSRFVSGDPGVYHSLIAGNFRTEKIKNEEAGMSSEI
jgi:hypothetical protein